MSLLISLYSKVNVTSTILFHSPYIPYKINPICFPIQNGSLILLIIFYPIFSCFNSYKRSEANCTGSGIPHPLIFTSVVMCYAVDIFHIYILGRISVNYFVKLSTPEIRIVGHKYFSRYRIFDDIHLFYSKY